jgi:hypothetical protein
MISAITPPSFTPEIANTSAQTFIGVPIVDFAGLTQTSEILIGGMYIHFLLSQLILPDI